jgi:hypothetical protein
MTIAEAAYEALAKRLREENSILKEQLQICQLEIQRLNTLLDIPGPSAAWV